MQDSLNSDIYPSLRGGKVEMVLYIYLTSNFLIVLNNINCITQRDNHDKLHDCMHHH